MSKKRKHVDELITAVPGEWKFDQQVAQDFDSHVRKSVPLYDEFQRMVVEMSEWFVKANSIIYDLGSSTGETISLLLKKHSGKRNVRFIGIDNSAPMIKAAEKKCNHENVEFVLRDVIEVAEFPNADFIISLYTLQFLPLKNRRKVLQRINRDLSEGGAVVISEKIRGENSLFEDLWVELYWDFKQAQGLSSDQVIQKAKSLRGVLVPLTLTENINLLREVGFSNIDVFAKWYNFAGIIAVKSGTTELTEKEAAKEEEPRIILPKEREEG